MAARLGARAMELTVESASDASRGLRRIRFSSEGLSDLSHEPGQDVMLQLDDGRGGRLRRRYTIRRLDRSGPWLDIDIVLHGEGPGARWAATVSEGEVVKAIAPRGKVFPDADSAWHLFAGDESFLPAAAAMAESLPEDRVAILVIETPGGLAEQPVETSAHLEESWLQRNGTSAGTPALLVPAMESVTLPPGEGHVYLGGEMKVVAAMRSALLQRGLRAEQISPKAYWRLGSANAAHGEPDRD